jgi:hypothetical protein
MKMKNSQKILVSAIGLVLATGMAISQPTVMPSGESLSIEGIEAAEGAILRITGPNGYRFAQEFEAGNNTIIDLKNTPFAKDGQNLSELPSGTYSYELLSRPSGKTVRGIFKLGNEPQDISNNRTMIQEEITTPSEREAALQAAAVSADEVVSINDTDNNGSTQLILEANDASGTLVMNWKMQNVDGTLKLLTTGDVNGTHIQMDPATGTLELLTGGLKASGNIAVASGGTGSVITGTGGLVSNGKTTSTGEVGIGTTNPLFPLEISHSTPVITLTDTDGGSNWKIQNGGGNFSIGTTGLSGQRVFVINDGSLADSLVISSSGVSVTSSRSAKTNIKQTSAEDVLAKLEELPIYTWSYTKDKSKSVHIGPMAEEFHQRFGFGDDAKRISSLDTGGLALAGVKALQAELSKRDAEIAELKATVALLLERTK